MATNIVNVPADADQIAEALRVAVMYRSAFTFNPYERDAAPEFIAETIGRTDTTTLLQKSFYDGAT